MSQISGASCTSVGGYAEPEEEDENTAQFDVSDNRTLDEVVNWLMSLAISHHSARLVIVRAGQATDLCRFAKAVRFKTAVIQMRL